MKIALVHDDLLQWGGAERVVKAMTEVWPKAPIYTSIASDRIVYEHFAKQTIIDAKFLHVPFRSQIRRVIFPVYPKIFQAFDLSGYDVILSSSTRFAHMVQKSNGTTHVTYCHTPARYFWEFDDYMQAERAAGVKKALIHPFLQVMRQLDYKAAQQVDQFIANSNNTAKKIKKIYGKQARIIKPFAEDIFFKAKDQPKDDYFLVVTRLLPWKRVEIAIEACRLLNKKLVIVGTGPDKARLENLARGTRTEFVEHLTDAKLIPYYSKSKALLVTQAEDFGLTPLEAQACGTPVIAFKKGGVLETILPNQTGIFYSEQSANSLALALKRFERLEFNRIVCKMNASKFTKQSFQQQLKEFVLETLQIRLS